MSHVGRVKPARGTQLPAVLLDERRGPADQRVHSGVSPSTSRERPSIQPSTSTCSGAPPPTATSCTGSPSTPGRARGVGTPASRSASIQRAPSGSPASCDSLRDGREAPRRVRRPDRPRGRRRSRDGGRASPARRRDAEARQRPARRRLETGKGSSESCIVGSGDAKPADPLSSPRSGRSGP